MPVVVGLGYRRSSGSKLLMRDRGIGALQSCWRSVSKAESAVQCRGRAWNLTIITTFPPTQSAARPIITVPFPFDCDISPLGQIERQRVT
jgi:hypothetical protein